MPLGNSLLRTDEVHIWYAEPLKIHDKNLLKEYFATLDSEEQSRYKRFLVKSKRLEYLIAHALLRFALSSYAPVEPKDWRFRNILNGRPEVCAPVGFPQPQFSLSHTDGLVAVCIAFGRTVGFDVEFIQNQNASLRDISTYFAESEIEVLKKSSKETQSQDFYRYWTLKEAYLKAQGIGLVHGLANISFQIDEEGRISISFMNPTNEKPRDWRFFLPRLTMSHQAAIAIRWGKPNPEQLEPHLRYWRVVPNVTGEEILIS